MYGGGQVGLTSFEPLGSKDMQLESPTCHSWFNPSIAHQVFMQLKRYFLAFVFGGVPNTCQTGFIRRRLVMCRTPISDTTERTATGLAGCEGIGALVANRCPF
jgi:hypothetical protein